MSKENDSPIRQLSISENPALQHKQAAFTEDGSGAQEELHWLQFSPGLIWMWPDLLACDWQKFACCDPLRLSCLPQRPSPKLGFPLVYLLSEVAFCGLMTPGKKTASAQV